MKILLILLIFILKILIYSNLIEFKSKMFKYFKFINITNFVTLAYVRKDSLKKM
jgi:hypothetical protein